MSGIDLSASNSPQSNADAGTNAIAAIRGPLLYGLRLWASACLALYIAFWLQLENAYWAGATAAIVCQPQLGASLRKASFRMIGTVVGAVAIMILTRWFPQDRLGFLLSLALWCSICGFTATILRNFAAYSASLAGYTAAIIAVDALGAVGGPSEQVFSFALDRASEIWIGIVSAGVVLAGTDFGAARRRLAAEFASLCGETCAGFIGSFLQAGPGQPDTRPTRRDLIRRVGALDPLIDQAIGEASDLRYRSRILQSAVGGLFAALSGWREAAIRLEAQPGAEARREAEIIRRNIPEQLSSSAAEDEAARWLADPLAMRRVCISGARALAALKADAPSLQLLADSAAEALLGLTRALNGLELLIDPGRAVVGPQTAHLRVPDWLPAWINAARVFVTLAAVELFWVAAAWPGGGGAIVFAAIVVILFSPQAERAYSAALAFLLGAALTTALAALVKFAILPRIVTFPGLCLSIGLVLVPAGSLAAQPWRAPVFTAITANFIPMLAPANVMSFDAQQFYNSALAIFVGLGAGAIAMPLLPPLSPAARSRRLLSLTLRDLRRLASRPSPGALAEWQNRIYGRLSALPDEALPVQRSQLAAALSVGKHVIRLRKLPLRSDIEGKLAVALAALAQGDNAAALEHFGELDRALAALPTDQPGAKARLRVRASILALSESLEEYGAYFGSEALA